MLGSAAEYVAVMDADLQHDETVLLTMVEILDREDVDIVIGSRYMSGGGFGDWDVSRQRVSRFASRLAKMVIKSEVSDPMSGFFMLRRRVFQECARHLSGIGFKIGLDLLMSAPTPLKIKEVPYEFGVRQAGTSKLDAMVAWEYVMMLLDKLIGHIVPIRFVLFSLVGVLGLGVHMAVLGVAFSGLNVDFTISQVIATMVAMTFNFLLNNFLTYRDVRLRRWAFVTGLLSFYAVCSVGAVANVGVAAYVFGLDKSWWIAGIAGVLIGAVWNYAVSSVYTWRRPKRA
jgi:dolichol-phosphate mannosyltransferase